MDKLKTVIKDFIKRFLLKMPYIGVRIKKYDHLIEITKELRFEPGHFYSPIPKVEEVEKDAAQIFGDKKLHDVDLNTNYQLTLLEEFRTYYKDYPYNKEDAELRNLRYKRHGSFYRYSDSVFLYCVLRSFKPQRIIEVGCGHSSALMLDTNEHFFNNNTRFTFIEPYPEERLMKILTEKDKERCNIIPERVQMVKPEVFSELNANDVLFIDSTHVSKTGSDVNYLFFEVLPALKPGVLIHIHDIFYPFEFSREWVLKYQRFWNEIYLLHAFLMNNKNYEIVAFNTYLQKINPDLFKNEMTECLIDAENSGSIWIRKIA